MEDNIFKQVATFQYSAEAQIFKGKLESNGIEVFVHDNFTIDSDPLLSNAIGGVKLFVKSEDYENALQTLSEISSYSVTETGAPIACPKCGSETTELFSTIKDFKTLVAVVVSLLFIVLPFYTKYNYRCENCGFRFS